MKKGHISGIVSLDFHLNGEDYHGEAAPVKSGDTGSVPHELDITLNAEHLGTIYQGSNKRWTLKNLADQRITDKIGEIIEQWYS